MSFGVRLTKARKAMSMTQQELGKGLGTDGKDATKSVVYGWEKGQHFPRVDQLVLICERLKCGADHLLFGGQSLSDTARRLAASFDRLPEAGKAVAEDRIVDVISDVRRGHIPLPTHGLGQSPTQETPPEQSPPPAPARPRSSGKNSTGTLSKSPKSGRAPVDKGG